MRRENSLIVGGKLNNFFSCLAEIEVNYRTKFHLFLRVSESTLFIIGKLL